MFKKICSIICLLGLLNDAYAQETIKVKDGSGATKEVLLLPFYPLASNISQGLEVVRSDYLMKKGTDFNDQLNKVALETTKVGGNVFQITGVNNTKQKGNYKIKGTAFHTDQYDVVKSRALELKNQNLENGKHAILTIYRPVYAFGFNDELVFDIIIDDTMRLEMKGNTKYIIKVDKDRDIKLSINDDRIIRHINLNPGKKYYVRTLANFPGSGNSVRVGEMSVRLHGYDPYFEVMDDIQGELESSLVNKITIISKKL